MHAQFQNHVIHLKIKTTAVDMADGRFLQPQWCTSSFCLGFRAYVFSERYSRGKRRYVCFLLERTPSKIVLSLMASQTCSCYMINFGIIPLNLYVSHFLLEQDGFHLLGGKTTQWGLSIGCSHTCQSCQLHPVQPLWTPVRNTRSLHRRVANTTLVKSLFIRCLFHVVNCVTPLL